jgi:hypothetical protein
MLELSDSRQLESIPIHSISFSAPEILIRGAAGMDRQYRIISMRWFGLERLYPDQ